MPRTTHIGIAMQVARMNGRGHRLGRAFAITWSTGDAGLSVNDYTLSDLKCDNTPPDAGGVVQHNAALIVLTASAMSAGYAIIAIINRNMSGAD